MRTISGKPISCAPVDEGILGSVGSGRKATIEDFLNNTLRATDYTLNSDMTIDITVDKVLFSNRIDIPVRIRTATDIEIVRSKLTTFALPFSARKIKIEKCDKLKEIVVINDLAQIEELEFVDCPELDLSGIEAAEIKKIRIINCGITSVKGLKGVKNLIIINRCMQLKDFDLENDNAPIISIEKGQIRWFNKPLYTKRLTLKDVNKSKSLELNIGNVIDLRIEGGEKMEILKIAGNSLDTLVIDGCDILKDLTVGCDCKTSLSLCNLKYLETCVFPPKISGHCVFENINMIPTVNCKKVITRK